MAWEYKSAISLSNSAIGMSGNESDYPFPFLGNSGLKTTGNGGYVRNANGYDVRFTSDSAGNNVLTFQLVPGTYNASTGAGEWWIKIGTFTTADMTIYVWAGNTGVTTDQSSTSTWDANFKGVWNLSETGTVTTWADALGVNNGSNSSTSPGTGKIGGGASFSAGNYIEVASHTSLNSPALTWEFWFRTSSKPYPMLMSRANSADSGDGIDIYLVNEALEVGVKGGTTYARKLTSTAATYADNNWHHVAITSTGGAIGDTLRLYIDGIQDQSNTYTRIWAFSGQVLRFGKATDTFWSNLVGVEDVIRVHSTPRSADWIKADYYIQNAPTSYYSLGAWGAVGGGGSIGGLLPKVFPVNPVSPLSGARPA